MTEQPRNIRRVLYADLNGFSAHGRESNSFSAFRFEPRKLTDVTDKGEYGTKMIADKIFYKYSDNELAREVIGVNGLEIYLSFDQFISLGRPNKLQIDVTYSPAGD